MKLGVNLINFGPGASPDSLEGWVDMMYALMDGVSLWVFTYFVLLVLLGVRSLLLAALSLRPLSSPSLSSAPLLPLPDVPPTPSSHTHRRSL